MHLSQIYLNDTHHTSMGSNNRTISGWPTISLTEKVETNLGCFIPNGYFSGFEDSYFGRYT